MQSREHEKAKQSNDLVTYKGMKPGVEVICRGETREAPMGRVARGVQVPRRTGLCGHERSTSAGWTYMKVETNLGVIVPAGE